MSSTFAACPGFALVAVRGADDTGYACVDQHLPATVAECFADYFARQPQVRTYVLDDQGRIRRHVAVFLAGEQLRDPITQSDPVAAGDEITVMQALSGG